MKGLRTLDEFMNRRQRLPNNSYVSEPGFKSLYIRDTLRFVRLPLGDWWFRTLDIANVEAEEPGAGAFTKLIARLRTDYPTHGIFVENALLPRFQRKLLALGFLDVGPSSEAPCYFLAPEEREPSLEKEASPGTRKGGQETGQESADQEEGRPYRTQ